MGSGISREMSRQKKSPSPAVIVSRPEIGQGLELTEKERKDIVQTWSSVEDLELLGERIYIQIFMHKPSLSRLFQFKGTSAEELPQNPKFKRQALAFSQFLDTVVKAVGENDARRMFDSCIGVGRFHRNLSTQFDPEWWKVFESAVLDQVLITTQHSPPPSSGTKRMLKSNSSSETSLEVKTKRLSLNNMLMRKEKKKTLDYASPTARVWARLLSLAIAIIQQGLNQPTSENDTNGTS